MKRITIGLMVLAFFGGAVHAQQSDKDQREKSREEANPLVRIYHERQKQNAEVEKQYKKTLQATDTKATPAANDPWANMRGSDTSKTKR